MPCKIHPLTLPHRCAPDHALLQDQQAGPRRRLQQTALTYTAQASTTGATPVMVGVNLGHRYPGSNWSMWMRRLGVNHGRVFLTTLWGSSLAGWVGSSTWGKSLDGADVATRAAFDAAVATLRTPAGHNPAMAGTFANPVKWAQFNVGPVQRQGG